ncbi:DUF268 domain-containing protein [Inhella sp.]|uniref:DUF268 domain-containing protein n=1 Tax=Inhella sp. TaxID=1921806 RepID=UPI0035B43485
MPRIVVYTVLTGSKEPLGDPLEGLSGAALQSDLEFDWVCFTDDPALRSPRWQMRLLQEPLPPERSSRRPKMLPHEYLGEWAHSLYIDNIVRFSRLPTRADLFGAHDPQAAEPLLRCFRHSNREDLLTEAEAIVQLGYERVDRLAEQLDFYRAKGWLEQVKGLSTCTLILRANHGHAQLRRFGQIWWEQFLLYGKRDQMSFDLARVLTPQPVDYWPGLKNDCPWLHNTPNIAPTRVLANFDATRYRWRYRHDEAAQRDPRRHFQEKGRHDGRQHARRLQILEWLSYRYGASLGSQVAPRRQLAQPLDDLLEPLRKQGGRLLVLPVRVEDPKLPARYLPEELDAAVRVLAGFLGAWEGTRCDVTAADLASGRAKLHLDAGRFDLVLVLGCPGPLAGAALRFVQEGLNPTQGLLLMALASSADGAGLHALESQLGQALQAHTLVAAHPSQHDELDAPLPNTLLALNWQHDPKLPKAAPAPAPAPSSAAPMPATEKLYIAYCTSGMGNRLRPLASAIAYCQATGRKLKVYWDDITPNGCLTPWSDLFTTPIEPISLAEIAALDPTRTALFTEKGPGHGVEREASRHERPQLLGLAQRGARLEHAQALRLDEAADVVIVYDNNYLLGLPKQASIEALRRLQPHPAVRDKVLGTVAGLGLTPATPAVHARGTDFNMKEALATYSALIDERIPQGEFFLSTEDAELEAGLRQRYGARLKSRPDRLHLQLQEGKSSWNDPDSYTITREHGIDALVDIYLLASVQLVVFHPGSTFSEIARHLHGVLQGLPAPQDAWPEGTQPPALAAAATAPAAPAEPPALAAAKQQFEARVRALMPRGGAAYPLDTDNGPAGPLTPEQLPPDFFYWESLGYRIPLMERLFMNSYSGQPELKWDGAVFNQLAAIPFANFPREIFKRICPYPEAWSQMATMRGYIAGRKVLVIGSETFWIELLCALGGAAEITTVEYRPIHWTEPPQANLRTLTWDQFIGDLDAHRERYDLILSYSSIEHSGLGRYGDRLTPLGDLFTFQLMAQCMKPTGLCTAAVPTGQDLTHFNAHRIYGVQRIQAMEQISGLKYAGIVYPDPAYLAEDPEPALRAGWTLQALATLPLGKYRQPILCFARGGFSQQRYVQG